MDFVGMFCCGFYLFVVVAVGIAAVVIGVVAGLIYRVVMDPSEPIREKEKRKR